MIRKIFFPLILSMCPLIMYGNIEEPTVSSISESLIETTHITPKFSEDGINTIHYLEKGGLAYEETQRCKKTAAAFGATTTIVSLALIPTIIGPFLAGGAGLILTSATGAIGADYAIQIKPTKNLGNLIKASYIYNGYSDGLTEQEKLKYKDTIEQFMSKYLTHAPELTKKDIASSILKANEKGWFGYVVNYKTKSKKNRKYFVGFKISRRKDIPNILFPNNQESLKLNFDKSITEKINNFKKYYKLQ